MTTPSWMEHLNERTILERAIKLVEEDRASTYWVKEIEPHGQFCPWCAIASAKGEIEKELKLSQSDSILGYFDYPLVAAREAIGRVFINWNMTTIDTKEHSLRLLREALAQVSNIPTSLQI